MDNNYLQPGQMLGPYRIIGKVGQGGMATVYKAYQPSMDRNVAIKVLPTQLADSKEFAARFQQEARIIARLEHPHILPVFDYGETDGVSYFVMRYLEAGTLKTLMEAGPLPLREIDRLFSQLADALGYAHGHGVVHRDLKPANALVDEQGNIFLTDFGIAKILESASPRLTQTDAIMGTPAYISPEQAKAMPVDRRSDIYSLGIILYEMVTGRVPFVADTPLAVILQHVSDPLPLPSAIKRDIPESIERVILKALAKEPSDRYANTAEFLSAWKRALEDSGTIRQIPERMPPAARTVVSAPPTHGRSATDIRQSTSLPQASTRSKGSSNGLLIGCGIVACLVLAVGGVAVFGTGILAALGQTTETPISIPTNTEIFIPPTDPPLPTDTPIPVPEILYEDDFSDHSLWGLLEGSDNVIEYDGDALRMRIFQENWFLWSTPGGDDYDSLHAEVTAINNDGEDVTAFGIMCYKQDDIASFYYVAMAADSEYVIAKATEGETDVFLTNNDEWAFSDLIEKNKSSYRVGMDCANGTITMYVDGVMIDTVKDSTYTTGTIGLIVWSGADVDHGDVTFDDFVVTSLE